MSIQLTVSNLSIRNVPSENYVLKAFYLNPNRENTPFFRQCRRLVQTCSCTNDQLSPNAFEYQPTVESVQNIIHHGYTYKPSLLFSLYNIDGIHKDAPIHVGCVKQSIEIKRQYSERNNLVFMKPNGKIPMEESVELDFELNCTFPMSMVEMYDMNVNRIQKQLSKSSQRNNEKQRTVHTSGKDLYSQVLKRHQESSQRKFEQEQYRINCENERLQQRLRNISLGKK